MVFQVEIQYLQEIFGVKAVADKVDTLTSSKQQTAFFGKTQKFGIFEPADKVVNDGSVSTSGMAKAERKALGVQYRRRMLIEEFVGDGDTIDLQTSSRFPVRFLGIDAAEKGLFRPKRASEPMENPDSGHISFTSRYEPLDGPQSDLWDEFVTDPFSNEWHAFPEPLTQDLIDHLSGKVGAGVKQNHQDWAAAASAELRNIIYEDRTVVEDREWMDMRFFTAFGNEFLDGYGRLLCFISTSEPIKENRNELNWNERLLKDALVSPYFIWPNVSPFLFEPSVTRAAYSPVEFRSRVNDDEKMGNARQWCQEARHAEQGIYNPTIGLKLQSFELRYLTNRSRPHRYVIDMGAADSDTNILPPEMYFEISNLEDRLYIPSEYVPLLVSNGWTIVAN